MIYARHIPAKIIQHEKMSCCVKTYIHHTHGNMTLCTVHDTNAGAFNAYQKSFTKNSFPILSRITPKCVPFFSLLLSLWLCHIYTSMTMECSIHCRLRCNCNCIYNGRERTLHFAYDQDETVDKTIDVKRAAWPWTR